MRRRGGTIEADFGTSRGVIRVQGTRPSNKRAIAISNVVAQSIRETCCGHSTACIRSRTDCVVRVCITVKAKASFGTGPLDEEEKRENDQRSHANCH
jgi:hypothetical protein